MDDQNPTQAPPTETISQNPPNPNPNFVHEYPKPQSPHPYGHHFIPSKIMILILIIFIFLAGGTGIYLAQKSKTKPVQKACTLEAKICPDGSSVGRTGPKCEFSPCPNKPTLTPDLTASWKTFEAATKDFEFRYPSTLYYLTDDGENGFYGGALINKKGISSCEGYLDCFYLDFERNTTPAMGDRQSIQKEAISLNGILWSRAYGENQTSVNGKYSDTLYYKRDNYYYSMSFAADSKSLIDENKELFEKIVSTFKFTETSPTPSCRPRPACLDATPRCLIPETSDMCPPTK